MNEDSLHPYPLLMGKSDWRHIDLEREMIGRIKKSLRLKWMLFSIFLATLPLAIAGFRIIEIYQKDLKRSVIEMEEVKAGIIVERTEAFLEKVTSNLLFLATDENFRRGRLSHIKGHLENLLYQKDYFMELTLLDEKGWERVKVSKYKVISSSDLRDQSASEMFRMASKGRSFFGEALMSPDETPFMIIAVPIEEYRGRPIGVMSAKIHLQYLWDLVIKTQIGVRGIAYVVDRDGTMIAHPDTKRVLMKENVSYLCATQCHFQKKAVFEFGWPSGERLLNVYKRIKEVDWMVLVQVPVEEAYGPAKQIANTALKWILVVLSMAALLSLLLTKRLIHPIKKLAGQMAEISRGNLDIHIETTAKDEVGLLTESFNQMIRDLKQSQGALKEAEAKYRNIFESSKDMIFITTYDGKFIEVNQAGADMLGYIDKEELMKIDVRDSYVDPNGRKRFQNEIAKDGFIKDFEIKLKRKDGTPIDCLITATVRKDGEGHTIGYEGIVKNISVRKKMEEELLRRAEELQTLYDLSALINQTLDLNKFFPMALERVSSLMGFEMGAIFLYDEDKGILELKFNKGYSPSLAESVKVLKFGEGISGKAVELKQPIVFFIDEYPFHRILPFLKEDGIQTLVGIPLLIKEKPIGAITLTSHSIHTLTQREINLLESIGSQIGLALENAKLFSDVTNAKAEWETTFDAVTDLISIKDKDYRILRANKIVFGRYGMRPGELIGKKCYEVFYNREDPCEGCKVSETLRTKGPAFGERESKLLNGVFQYFTFPIFDEEGEVIAVVDSAREITEKKRLELEKEVLNNVNKILASSLDVRQVMKAVHSELKRVIESERMTITLLDEGGERFRYFALEKDYDAEELVRGVFYPKKGAPFEIVVGTGQPIIISDIAESDSWVNQELLKEGIRSSLVFPLEYKGEVMGTINFGSKKANHFSEYHINFLSQFSTGLAVSIKNSLLLDEIKESEEKYRVVVENAHDGVLVVGEDYRFKYVNERLAEILGYKREELVGMDFRDCLDKANPQSVVDGYVRWQRRENVLPRFEFNVLRKDGQIRNVETNSTVTKDSKGNINTIAFMKDITEKRKMEEQLLQTEKLRALGEMATGVAHDFNNALAAILGNTQLLLYTAKDEALREALQTIEKVAKDSAQTVRRLQEFTRKKVHQELFKLDVNSIIRDSIEITKPKWKDETQIKGIHIEMVSNFNEIPPALGNASEMREVITNMIFNAVEAMPEGGKIEIRTFEKKGKVHIQILDTGIGMIEEVRKKIFEPFYTSKPFSNTGLGLSMAYGIIKRFGGEIEVESKVGYGATFTIILPIGLEGKGEEVPSLMIKKGRTARILVIDDEESVRSVLSGIFSQVGHQVTIAGNGEEGIRLFREKRFDIVLTDLGMPGIPGWEVCRTIKEINPHTPVGMITGWGLELSQEKMEECGLDFLISKPFDFNQILKVVAETMESKA